MMAIVAIGTCCVAFERMEQGLRGSGYKVAVPSYSTVLGCLSIDTSKEEGRTFWKPSRRSNLSESGLSGLLFLLLQLSPGCFPPGP